MKTITLLIALAIAPMASYSQSMFETLEEMNDVSSVIVNKDAFEILSKFNPKSNDNEAMEVFNMIKELNEFKWFSTDDIAVANKMETMVKTAVKSLKLTELMRAKDEDSRVKIYVRASINKEYVSEVLMFVRGISKKTNNKSESMILSLTGMINLNKMSELADTFIKDKN
jgi:hypothetical protein